MHDLAAGCFYHQRTCRQPCPCIVSDLFVTPVRRAKHGELAMGVVDATSCGAARAGVKRLCGWLAGHLVG